MEQENKDKEAQNPSEASTEVQSEKETPKSLKPKPKIAKKSPINDLKPKKAKDTFRIRHRIRKRKNKKVIDGKKGNSSFEQEDSKKITAKEEKQEDISNREDTGKSQHGEKDKEEIGGSDKSNQNQRSEDKSSQNRKNKEKITAQEEKQEDISNREDTGKSQHGEKDKEEIGGSDKSHQNQRSEDKSSQNQKNKENRGDFRKSGSDKSSRNHKNREKHCDIGKSGASDKSLRDQKNKEKHKDKVKSQEKEKKKDKLAGLIFMCSKKTKPDCFHYRVMGVSASRKDLVLDIKPGLKLFLYDYDLKLMYGIYKASSSGGMKLEPKAFGGAFPAQVRFNVHVDCLPLPENIFKKAIKENYNEKNKFKFELTAKQVRKLSELFRPASIRPTALPVRSPIPKVQDREVYAGRRESNRETFARDDYVDANSRRYNGLSHERDLHYAYGKGASSRREEAPRDLYLSEKEYRAYGLQGERKNLTTHHVAPLEPYQRGNEREHQLLLRHPDPLYRDTIPASREPVPADSLYLNVGARHELRSAVSPPTAVMTLDSYTRDPYGASHYGPSVDRYLPPARRDDVASGSYLVDGRRETYLVGTDSLRRETDQADRLYSTYAANALSNYNQQHHCEGAKLELAAAPVSSRYSFAGPSLSYR